MERLDEGLAAEHLVCADLILQGYKAFLANQNCPYDVVAEANGRLFRIQVKATNSKRSFQRRTCAVKDIYRFGLRRRGRSGKRILSADDFDIVALVALDTRKIAYLGSADCKTGDKVKTCIELRDSATYVGRSYSNGTTRRLGWSRMFDAYQSFYQALPRC